MRALALARALTGSVLTAGALALGASMASASETYTVRAGDTLAGIAADHDHVETWRDLAEVNADTITDPNLILVGQELRLTGAAASNPAPTSEPATSSNQRVPTSTWDRLAECESNGNWNINTGNGYYGGLQFALRSWEWVGGSGMPHQASKQEQINRAELLLERQGWGAWPACSRALGLR